MSDSSLPPTAPGLPASRLCRTFTKDLLFTVVFGVLRPFLRMDLERTLAHLTCAPDTCTPGKSHRLSVPRISGDAAPDGTGTLRRPNSETRAAFVIAAHSVGVDLEWD